ncbi:MAG TPA: VIT and VWA domain-containing protein, partial [Blastocatellia bacterium]
MQRRFILFFVFLSTILIAGYITLANVAKTRGTGLVAAAAMGKITQGSLQVVDPEKGVVSAECPLKQTDVKAEISGFLSRVVVTQEFENQFKDKIEAIYTFPLPQNAAVDDMTMRVGDRTVRGRIKRREEARAIYDAARAAGNVASLLDQERPNIFTQSVANIMPGERVTVTISYVETLKYEDGSYEFVFPMVVGPRYIPGTPDQANLTKQGGGGPPDTLQVPDASRITPPVAAKGTRAGHDISIEVALDAGVMIDTVKSTLHEIDTERPTDHSAFVRLKNKAEIPNKDFILRYDVAGRGIEDAVLAHRSTGRDPGAGFFTMILQPPERVTVQDVTPKEIVFVLDTSGSMTGFPIEKAKEAMKLALDGLYPQDTFNLITFAGDTSILFPEPVHATGENLKLAQEFLSSRQGRGGTEMMKAIRAALDPSDAQGHIRIVCFMTDGYVGNDLEIVSEVQKHPNARVFSFGIGSSVNRFLLDKMAEQGRGEVEYDTLSDDGSAAAKRFHERIRNPLLTDISIDWAGLPVTDIYPKRIPDLFSAKPVVLCGRYTSGSRGVIKLKGKMSGREWAREIPVELPESESRRDVLATLWARARIDDLMSRDYNGIQQGNARADVSEAITELGLNYRLMTQFTSFVAVEEMIVTDGGAPRKVEVPIDMPEGVSHKGIFGNEGDGKFESLQLTASLQRAPAGRGVNKSAAQRRVDVAGPKAAPPSQGESPKLSQSSSQPNMGGGVTLSDSLSVGNNPLSPEEQKRQQFLARLHPSIVAVIERLKIKDAKPSDDEARFVRKGKAEIQVWLIDKSPEVIAQLKQLGFEVVLDPKTARIVIGRVPVERLA